MKRPCALALVALAGIAAHPAQAHVRSGEAVVVAATSDAALSDQELAQVRGGQTLTVGTLLNLTDAQARQSFRIDAEIGRTQMDVWWGTTGAELIATAVRAGL